MHHPGPPNQRLGGGVKDLELESSLKLIATEVLRSPRKPGGPPAVGNGVVEMSGRGRLPGLAFIVCQGVGPAGSQQRRRER